ncbi:MAG TPA: hypothetical protein VGH03_10705 [Caulobacteraceae bacterium]|jgi:predicted small secreted protein
MKSKIGLVAAVSAAGALLAACHGSFYGGGDVGVAYASPAVPDGAAAASTARSTTASSNAADGDHHG